MQNCIQQAQLQLLDRVLHCATTVYSSVMIQFIFDSYIDLAIKDSERIRSGTDVTYELERSQTNYTERGSPRSLTRYSD